MKIIYNKKTFEILGVGENIPENNNQGLAEIPDGFELSKHILWKYNPNSKLVELKKGEEYVEALELLAPRLIKKLINKYASSSMNPVIIGSLEAAADIVVQFVHKLIAESKHIPQSEKDKWNSFYYTNNKYFKLKLEDAGNKDWYDMAKLKSRARKMEKDMKSDPEWPKK